MKLEEKMKNTNVELRSSADSATLCAMLASVVGFDIFLGVAIADYGMLATIGLALIILRFC